MNDRQQEIAKAGGELLAAEATYLRAHGWVVFLQPGPGEKSVIRWSKTGTGSLPQGVAVAIQRANDPLMRG